jgi:hypothetical protein
VLRQRRSCGLRCVKRSFSGGTAAYLVFCPGANGVGDGRTPFECGQSATRSDGVSFTVAVNIPAS